LKPDKLNKQIIISGGHGYGNVGDEAQLAFNIKFLRDNYPDYKIVVLTPNKEYSRNQHNIDVELAPRVAFFNAGRTSNYGSSNRKFKFGFFLKFPRLLFNARLLYCGFPMFWINPEEARLLDSINKSSLLLLSGGGYLTGMTLSRLWDNCLLIRLGSAMNVPAVASGQTIGVFKDKISPILAKWGLKRLKFITVRDKKDSIKALSSIGIKGNHITSTFDDALFCEASSKSRINDTLKNNGILNDKPYVVVNAHYWGQKDELSNRIISEMADFCDKISNQKNVNIIFLPMHKSDEKPESHIIKKMKTKNVYLYKYGYDFKDARGLIKFSECCVTMKHHPIVFSCGEEVPVISIAFDDYYKHKNIGALSLFHQDGNIILSNGNNLCNDLLLCYNKIIENKTEIVKHLHKCLENYKKDAGKSIKQFFDTYSKA
ncbi:polysaccharide pyruvyl transferase family protein, partial [bacterium]|nr:polysaccharide pyruvyl transferase family protein [bacterium]